MKSQFEQQLVKAFNELYGRERIAALCYRLPQIRFNRQGFDIYSDSTLYEWYFAIECKSIDASKTDKLYFTQHFHHSEGVHQIQFENDIICKSGRIGFLAVELRNNDGLRHSCFLVPWSRVWFHYQRDDVGLEQEEVTYCTELEWYKGGYHFNDDILKSYKNQIGAERKDKYPSRFKRPVSKKVK